MNIFSRQKLGRYHSTFNRVHKEPAFSFWKRFIKKFFMLLAISGIVYFLMFSNFFLVQQIDVQGQKLIKKDEILLYLPTNENIFLYPVTKKTTEIKNHFPAVADLKILRGLPKTLTVSIQEFEPMLVWERDGAVGYVNEEGVFYYKKDQTEKDANIPRVIETFKADLNIGDVVATATFIKFIRDFSIEMRAMPGLTFDHIELGAVSFDALIKTKENIDIFVSSDDDFDRQIYYLRTILEKRHDKVTKKIDVRIPRWAYLE